MSIKKITINFDKILLIIFTLVFSMLIKFPNHIFFINKYFIFISIPMLIVYYFFKLANLKINILCIFILIYSIYYLFQDIYVSNDSIGEGVFWWIFLVFFFQYFNLLKKEKLIFSIKLFLISTILNLSIDFIYRFYLNPNILEIYKEDIYKGILFNFYMYKEGIIGGDTNVTGIVSSLCLSASLILKDKKIISKWYSVIFFIFTLFTFSRAAIVTSIFIMLYRKIKKKRINRIIVIILTIFFILIGLFILAKDGSGKTKLLFIQEASYKFLSFNIKEMLFGVNHKYAKLGNHYPHLLYLLLVLEKGILGLVLFKLFIIIIFLKNKNLRIVLLTYLIEGFSYITLSSPTLSYFIMIFICLNNKGVFK